MADFNLKAFIAESSSQEDSQGFDLKSFIESAPQVSEEYAKKIKSGEITTSPVDATIAEAEQIQKEGVKVDPVTAIAGQTVSTATFKAADKLANQFTGGEYEKFVERASSDNMLVNITGNLFGYLLNPAGRAIRGAAAAKNAGVIQTAVLEVLGVEGGAAAVDLIDQAIKAPGQFKEALAREGVELGMEIGGALIGGAATKTLLKPGKTLQDIAGSKVLKPIFNKIKQAYPENTRQLLENAPEIIANEGKEGLARKVAQQFDELTTKLGRLKTKSVQEGAEQVAALSDEIQGSVNKHLEKVIKGVDDPKQSIKALVGLADDIKVAEDGMSSMYDVHLNKIKDLTKGKKVNLGQSKKDILEIFELEGLVDSSGRFVNKTLKSQYPAAEKMIREIGSSDKLSHEQLGRLVKFLGSSFDEGVAKGVNSNVINQARKAYTGLRQKLVDPELWGKEASVVTEDMLNQYFPAKSLFSTLRKTSSETIKPSLIRMKEQPTLELFEELAKGFQQADTAASKLQGFKSYSALVPENVQAKIKTGLKESRQLVDYSKAKSGAEARKVLNKVFKTQDTSKIDNVALEKAIRNYAQMDEFIEQGGANLQAFPDLKAAFENPMDTKLVNRAVKWAEKYAKQIGPDLKDNVNALAKFNRLAKIKPGRAKFLKELKTVESILDPTDYKTVKIFSDFFPEAQELARTLELEKLIRNKDTSLSQYLPSGIGIAGGFYNAAVAPLIVLSKIAKDPVALRLVMEKSSQKGISAAQFQAITKAAKMSAVIAEEMNNIE